jgi:dephospho-CoA kinase
MKIIGLTGSIAMGKTDTARLFAEQGIPVFDSDAVVHKLYAHGGRGVAAVQRLFPEAVVSGAVDRQRLAAGLVRDPALLSKLEALVHPLVRAELTKFLAEQRSTSSPLVVVDVPLLFETGRENEFDVIVVVSAPAEMQSARALARSGMTDETLKLIMSRQMPDAEKRKRADYVVDTGKGHDVARGQVREIVNQLSV